MSGNNGNGDNPTNGKDGISFKSPATWIAIGVLAVFFVIAGFLLMRANDAGSTDTIWLRYVYVYDGIEALVFAAAAWIFGREVNRRRAETAEGNAERSTMRATANEQEKANGRALAASVIAVSRGRPGPGGPNAGPGSESTTSQAGTLDLLASQARALFPDIQP